MNMKRYHWSSAVVVILLHLSFNALADEDIKSDSDRPARQVQYRGNYKFQVPEYVRYGLSPDGYAKTIYSNDHRGADGSFGYEYQTDNGIQAKQESTGYGPNKVVRGYYSYLGSDGKQYTVNYVADRFGYRAYGDHLPGQGNYQHDPIEIPIQHLGSRPSPSNFVNHQHHTQTAFIPTETLQSQNIYVADGGPSNYVTITPRPIVAASSPRAKFIAPSAYNQIAWTTQRPYVSFN